MRHQFIASLVKPHWPSMDKKKYNNRHDLIVNCNINRSVYYRTSKNY